MRYTEGKNYLWQPILLFGLCYLWVRQDLDPGFTKYLFFGLVLYSFIAQIASGVALNRYWTACYPKGEGGYTTTLVIYGVCILLMAGYLFAPEFTESVLNWKQEHADFLSLPEDW